VWPIEAREVVVANRNIFSASRGPHVPAAATVNHAGGLAYDLSAQQALAQYTATGCLAATFYASAEEQLEEVLRLAQRCEPAFVARCAVYGRTRGYLKDSPALLLACLTVRGPDGLAALRAAWPSVIDSGKMLRNFAQIVRSGAVGRKSFGTALRRLIREWLAARSPEDLFRDSVGEKPSLADVIKMVHPTPSDPARRALYGYLLRKPHDPELLPAAVQSYERYKWDRNGEVPNVPFQMLDSLELTTPEWTTIARRAGWQMTRMNLNTFQRHGVLDDAEVVQLLAQRLRDPKLIADARIFPYQLMMAYLAASEVPRPLVEALQDAMELSVANVPSFDCDVVVCPDVSGSMSSNPVTGARKGATTKVRCIDVAALLSAAVLRKNPSARVLPFEIAVVPLRLNGRDSVSTIAQQIAAVGGGGTNCSAPLELLNREESRANLVIYVSDNESWADRSRGGGTGLAHEWAQFKRRNPKAKLVCIDLAPNTTSQVESGFDRLNVGGFSDAVFDVIRNFVSHGSADHWVAEIERIAL
jgi:60 kDa SS-A/Ro ribonucleoprotein